MNKFLLFIILVVFVEFFSVFVHEFFHFVPCVLAGGSPVFEFYPPFFCPPNFPAPCFLSILGSAATTCNVVWADVFVREAIAYSGQSLFIGGCAFFLFRWLLQ